MFTKFSSGIIQPYTHQKIKTFKDLVSELEHTSLELVFHNVDHLN